MGAAREYRKKRPKLTDEWHLVPRDGPKHFLTMDCWCEPKQDDGGSEYIVHNEAPDDEEIH